MKGKVYVTAESLIQKKKNIYCKKKPLVFTDLLKHITTNCFLPQAYGMNICVDIIPPPLSSNFHNCSVFEEKNIVPSLIEAELPATIYDAIMLQLYNNAAHNSSYSFVSTDNHKLS